MPNKTSSGGTPSGWVAVALARKVWRRFCAGWENLEATSRRSWIHWMTGGAFGVALLTVVLTWGGQRLAQAGLLDWEASFLRSLSESPISFQLALWVETSGNSLYIVPLTLFAAGWAAWHHQPLRAFSFVVGLIIAKSFVFVGWRLWARARPTLIESGAATPEALHAFPSGHVVQALFIYGLLAYLWGRLSSSLMERLVAGLFILLMVSFSGIGRMRVGAHWPSDILAGLLIGGAWLAVVILALRSAESKKSLSSPASR